MLTASVLFGIAVALVRALLGRADLRLLATVRFRHWWLFVAAVSLKLALARWGTSMPQFEAAVGPLQLTIYALVLLALWLNRRLPWMGLAAAGTLLNLAVVGLNGGRMPVTEGALQLMGKTAGLQAIREGGDLLHVIAGPDTAFEWLGDWIPMPLPPTAVVSPGDVLLVLGAVLYVNSAITPRPAVTTGAHGRAPLR